MGTPGRGRPRSSTRQRNKLGDWMEETGTTPGALAPLLGCAASTVYALREGRIRPGLNLGVKIEELTGIPVSYWAEG